MLHRHPHHLDDSPRRAAPDGRVVYPSGPSSITFLPALHHRAEFEPESSEKFFYDPTSGLRIISIRRMQ